MSRTWLALIAVACLVGAGSASAATLTFTAAGGDWATGGNWDLASLPGTPDTARIRTATTPGAPAYIQSNVGTMVQWQVGSSATGSNGYLNINAGARIQTIGTGEVGMIVYNGTVTQTGGDVVSGKDAQLNITNGGTSAQALYQISGGTLTVGGIWFGHSAAPTASGTFLQTGGVVTLTKDGSNAGRWPEGATSVNIILSGGTLTASAGTPNLGNGSMTTPATLTISDSAKASMKSLTVGKVGKVVLNGSKTGDGTDFSLVSGDRLTFGDGTNAGATLLALIDDAAVATPSVMRKVAAHELTINAGSYLDVGFKAGSTAAPGTWTILTWNGSNPVTANLGWAATVDTDLTDGTGWSSTWDTGAKTLSVTYVPEPATMALLALGGLGMLIRRKRSK